MPESGPDIDEGASGWASGSQLCKGNKPHLHREAEEEADDDRRADGWRQRADLVGERGELERADLSVRNEDAEVHHIGARRAHQEIDEAGAQRLRRLFVNDQEIGRPGHQLPEDIEIAEFVGRREADQRTRHQEGEEIVAVGGRGAADVADRIDDHQRGDAGEQQRKQSGRGIEAAVERDDRDGGERQQNRGRVSRARGNAADQVDQEAADVGGKHGRRPRRLELRHARGSWEPGERGGGEQERRRPQADHDRQRGERIGERGGSARSGRKRDFTRLGLEADALHNQHVIGRGDDGRERPGQRDRPIPPLDRGIEDNELGERSLERRKAHYREDAEPEQRRCKRHAGAAAGKLVEVRGSCAADETYARGEHEAAHHRLIEEMHQGAGVAGGSADAKADQRRSRVRRRSK